MLKRIFDIVFSLGVLVIFAIPILVIAAAIRLTSQGPAIYWSDRVGKDNRIFRMPKFRTMHVDTPAVATHLMKNPDAYLTSIGSFLRKFSLDELPIPIKVEFDSYYLKNRSFFFDLKILWMTLIKVVKREGVTH